MSLRGASALRPRIGEGRRRKKLAMACQASTRLQEGAELKDAASFADLKHDGVFTVSGFGSLLSERSARSTFPDLLNFRTGRLRGYRRVFAHTADVFYARGVARPDTREVASLSCEPCPGAAELVVSLFEVPLDAGGAAAAAFIAREHEFRFVAVRPIRDGDGAPEPHLAVLCAAHTDAEYRAARCPPDEWARRWARWGVETVWDDATVLPCRPYLRHCVLAARRLGDVAAANFLDATFLADRATSVRQYLDARPEIMDELPPPELRERYGG